MRKNTLIFIIVVVLMGMFTGLNAKAIDLTVANGGFKSYFTVGLAPSIQLHNNLYLEGELFYLSRTGAIETSHLEYLYDELYVNETITKKTSAVNLNISVLYRLMSISNRKWFPYLTIGAGYLSEKEKWQRSQRLGDNNNFSSGSNRDHKWDFCFGGGVKYGLTDRVGIRFDGRFLYIFDQEDGESVLKFFGPRFTGGFYIKL